MNDYITAAAGVIFVHMTNKYLKMMIITYVTKKLAIEKSLTPRHLNHKLKMMKLILK